MVYDVFPNTDDYVLVTESEEMEHFGNPMTLEEMRILTGCDFWGLFVANPDGSVKKALYNSYELYQNDEFVKEQSEAQKAYRESLYADFSIATNEVAVGERLVLHMWCRDGWGVIAERGQEDWSFTVKHSPKYYTR